MRRIGALFLLLTIAGCSESSDDAFSDSTGGLGSGGASGSGGSAAGAGGSTAGSMNGGGGGAAGASGAAGQGAMSGSSPIGGSAGAAGSPIGGSGGASGSGGGAGRGGAPMCPDEEPPPPPAECAIGQSVLSCRYERPNPDDPSQTCSVTYRCQCVSDHMGGADCSWLGGSPECPR